MDNLWNSSGRFSQDPLQWESSIRFNRRCENYSVNQRTSQAGSSSYQCLTTLYWMQKEMMKYVTIIQRQLNSMLEDFLAVIGLSLGPGSEKKWYGTYDHKPDGSRDRTAEKMLLTFAWYQCLGEMRFKEQRKWKEVNTLQWQHQKTLSCFSKLSSPSISPVSTEQLRK